MKGFIIFNNKDGNLIYSRYMNNKNILSKEYGYRNLCFDDQDPEKIAAQFFMLIEMGRVVQEEYEEEFPDDNDPNTKMAWKTGLQSYSSNSVDYMLEHHDEYPLTLVLFYDCKDLDEKIMRYMIITLLHIYVVKKEAFLRNGDNP